MTDSDDMAARSKRLAKTILDALDKPKDPERRAYEEQKDREDREALEKFYLVTGQKPPPHAESTDGPIVAALHELADRVEQTPHVGSFAPIDVGFTPVEGTKAVLRFSPLPSTPESGRYVELRVFSKSGQSKSSQWLTSGSNDVLFAYLRRPDAVTEVMKTMREIVEAQQRHGMG